MCMCVCVCVCVCVCTFMYVCVCVFVAVSLVQYSVVFLIKEGKDKKESMHAREGASTNYFSTQGMGRRETSEDAAVMESSLSR